jgi:RIO-like serine/threonine protein kinase
MAGPRSSQSSDREETSAEILSLQGLGYAARFFGRKNLTLLHLELLASIELLSLSGATGTFPSKEKIAKHLKLDERKFIQELKDLVEHRLVHEIIPTYGDASKTTYKLGATGGSIMMRILHR